MAHSDWIPTREQDLMDLCHKWVVMLADQAKITAFGWNAAECTAIVGKVNGFLTARNTYEGENSTEKRLAKDEAKEEAIDAMRDFANSSVRFNKIMDDPAKLHLGIHPKDTTPTTHGTPTSQPDTVVENTLNHYEHRVKAMNHGTRDASKPADAYGVRYAWQVGGTKPASGADLPKTKFSRKTTHVVTHTEADRGTLSIEPAPKFSPSRSPFAPLSPALYVDPRSTSLTGRTVIEGTVSPFIKRTRYSTI